VIALHRADLDLAARTVRVRAAYVRHDAGPLLLGPPKSKASRRIVGIPATIVPELEHHLAVYVADGPANSGAGLRDLMARMGHDSTRAAMIYQHVARGADKAITDAIDEHVEDQKRRDNDGDDGAAATALGA
jgi:hypothetical protein